MYTLGVRRPLQAQHYLIGGDWGRENEPHLHEYTVELQLEAAQLDEHGYVADIVHVEQLLERTLARFAGCMLNDLPSFAGLNPSIEHLARILCHALRAELEPAPEAIAVLIWEDDIAWTRYRLALETPT